MKTWFFSECPYPDLPDPSTYDSIRVTLPNGNFDPEKGADVYQKHIEMYLKAEELGFDLMFNEHHQTPTCIVPAVPVMVGILAALTKKARLLVLGNPVTNRSQPVRIAEEMAMVDVISRGRLECGFVRGVPYESSAANISAHRGTQKLWEAHDLILKAWTTHDGPFNFEGEFFHHRQVNIWPRPFQQPTPPVWITVGSGPSAVPVAQKGHVGAVFIAGYQNIRKIYDSYRNAYREAHKKEAPLDRFAYNALIFVGETEEKAAAGIDKLLWYLRTSKGAPQFSNPPGYHPPALAASFLKEQPPVAPITAESQISRGVVFAGTPDQVYEQIKQFWEYSGGFGHLLCMGHGGHMTQEETMESMRLFATKVRPRLNELTANYDPARMAELRAATPDRMFAEQTAMSRDFSR